MSSDRWNEGKIWILRGQTFKFFDECCVVRLPVRIEQIQFVWQTFLGGLLKDAANGRNPDATREKHRRPGDISMQREGSPGTAHDELRAKRSRLQRGLKTSLSHAHRDHDRPFLVRRACERKGPGIVAFTFYVRARNDKVGMLPCPESEAGTIGVKPEGHRISGDSLPIHQSHFIFRHLLLLRTNLTWFLREVMHSNCVNQMRKSLFRPSCDKGKSSFLKPRLFKPPRIISEINVVHTSGRRLAIPT